MKTFKDLKFKNHEVQGYFDKQAFINFENKYGILVINGKGAYCGKDTFEVAILYEGEITYNSDITDDILRHQSEEDINGIMKKLQLLRP